MEQDTPRHRTHQVLLGLYQEDTKSSGLSRGALGLCTNNERESTGNWITQVLPVKKPVKMVCVCVLVLIVSGYIRICITQVRS